MLLHLPIDHTAEAVHDALTETVNDITGAPAAIVDVASG